MSEDPPEKSAERPLECSECKKPVAVLYTVVAQGAVSHTVMCGGCPQLECRLHGTSSQVMAVPGQIGLACPECGTSLGDVRSGRPLGCTQCYDTFAEQIIADLVTSDKIPQVFKEIKKDTLFHIGRAPGEASEISPALKLHALNQALAETLSREDYEQAAWLRDQIKQLTERSHDG